MVHSQSLGQGARGEQNKCGVATKVVNLTKDLGLNIRVRNQRSWLPLFPENRSHKALYSHWTRKPSETTSDNWCQLTDLDSFQRTSSLYHWFLWNPGPLLRSPSLSLCSLLMSAYVISVKWVALKITVLIRCIHYSSPNHFSEEGLWELLSQLKSLLFALVLKAPCIWVASLNWLLQWRWNLWVLLCIRPWDPTISQSSMGDSL